MTRLAVGGSKTCGGGDAICTVSYAQTGPEGLSWQPSEVWASGSSRKRAEEDERGRRAEREETSTLTLAPDVEITDVARGEHDVLMPTSCCDRKCSSTRARIDTVAMEIG